MPFLAGGREPVPGYKLVRKLGEGAFGEVWLATGPGGTEVALKFLPLHGASGLKEFKALSWFKHIKHPNLLPVVALWLLDGQGDVMSDVALDVDAATSAQSASTLIVAMGVGEKNLGEVLEDHRRQGREGIPADELLDYIKDSARAIDFLNAPRHNVGEEELVAIQHRDIKPENILLVGGVAVVCDFGVARVLHSNSLTMTGMIGSPAYMAPEFIEGKQPGRTADQYSLALTYYSLRTGKLPFPEDSNQFAAINCHLKGDLDLSHVPEAERSVLRKATCLVPESRYETCTQMVQSLKRAVAEGVHESVGAAGTATATIAANGGPQPSSHGAEQGRQGGTLEPPKTPSDLPHSMTDTPSKSTTDTAAIFENLNVPSRRGPDKSPRSFPLLLKAVAAMALAAGICGLWFASTRPDHRDQSATALASTDTSQVPLEEETTLDLKPGPSESSPTTSPATENGQEAGGAVDQGNANSSSRPSVDIEPDAAAVPPEIETRRQPSDQQNVERSSQPPAPPAPVPSYDVAGDPFGEDESPAPVERRTDSSTTRQGRQGGWDQTNSSDAARYGVVVSVANLERLFESLERMGDEADLSEYSGMLPVLLSRFTKGVDSNRPAGLLIDLHDAVPSVVGFVPVSHLGDFATGISDSNGATRIDDRNWRVTVQEQPLFVTSNGDWAFLSNQEFGQQYLPRDPSHLLRGLDQQYLIAARLNMQAVPAALRQLALLEFQKGFRNGLQPSSGFGEAQADQLAANIEQLINETEQLTVGLGIDEQSASLLLDFESTARVGTRLARQFESMTLPQSRMSGFNIRMPGLITSLHIASAIPRADMDQMTDSLDEVRETALDSLANDLTLDEDSRDQASDFLDTLFDVLDDTILEGTLEGGACAVLDRGAFSGVAGLQVADGRVLESEFEWLAEQIRDVSFTRSKRGELTLYSASFPLAAGSDIRRVFGDSMPMIVAFGANSVYCGVGQRPERLLATVVSHSARRRAAARPLSLHFSLGRLLELANRLTGDATMIPAINALKEAKNDTIQLTASKAGPRSFRYRLSAGAALFKAISVMAQQK